MPVEFEILDESPYLDTEDPAKPVRKIMVTFQLPDGRVETLRLLEAGYSTDVRNKAIVEAIQKMPKSPRERVRIP
jgi:hypothetical protein